VSKTSPSISIIIPAYNVENYLAAALDSIKAQTVLPEEVVLIDDGSIDSTLEVANAYNFSFPYQVVSIENSGQGHARNLGVSLASSEYVYFFDSDDLLTNNFIGSIKEHIRNSGEPDILLFSGDSFNDIGYKGNRWVDYSRGFSGTFTSRVDFLDKGMACNGLFCSPCLYVSKKSLWGEGRLEFGSNFLEDEALFYPVIFACASFNVIDEVFFLRRNREGSTMTMAFDIKHVNGAKNCIETAFKLYAKDYLSDKERWHISKRLEGHCVRYMLMARAASLKCSYKHIFSVIKATKNIVLVLKVCIYAIQLDRIYTIRKIGRVIRKMKLKCTTYFV
jgi:glycosyltransferase involved in cell wall biosynthesis